MIADWFVFLVLGSGIAVVVSFVVWWISCLQIREPEGEEAQP